MYKLSKQQNTFWEIFRFNPFKAAEALNERWYKSIPSKKFLLVIVRSRCTWGPIYGSGCLSLTDWPTFWNLTDVTLADEDVNPILTDDVNSTFNIIYKAMWQCKWHNFVANFGTNQCKWRHLMTKFWIDLVTQPGWKTWWPNLELMQVAPPHGQICN